MGIFNIFIKKDNKFLSLLNQLVAKTTEASEKLVLFMKTDHYGPEREAISAKIKESEVAGDVIYDQIFDELNTTFITPFDREDIQALGAKLDDVLDFINGVAKRTIMFRIDEIPQEFVVMAEIIREQCISLQVAMAGLGKVTKSPELLKKECLKVRQLETQADEVFAKFITELFATCKDPVELIKQNRIIQFLEDTTDVTEEVADVIKTIIVKYN